jgi:excisionase family DNA binding protein
MTTSDSTARSSQFQGRAHSKVASASLGSPTSSTAEPARDASDTPPLLTPDDLSAWLRVPKQTVYRWRTRGGGPRGYRVGRHVRYAVVDVERWLLDQRDV